MTNVGGRIGSVVLVAVVLAGCALPRTTPTPVPTETIGPSPSPSGITRDQAVSAARAAAPRYATDEVLGAEVGRFEDLVSRFTAEHFSPVPEPDRLVWRVRLGEQPSPTGGQGVDVIIDFWDGGIILAVEWVS